MAGRGMPLRGAGVSPAEALRGLVAFVLLAATLAGMTAGLLFAGERPGPPPAWPRWGDVVQGLRATEPPLEALRYGVSMAGWLLLAYVAAVLVMRALAGTLVALTRGAAWAQDLVQLVDLVTIPWVRRGISGGLMAALLVSSLVRTAPELPRISPGGGEGFVGTAPMLAPSAGGEEAAVAAAPAVEAPASSGADVAAAAASSGAEEGIPGGEGAPAAAAGQAAAEGQRRERPELPAPVVVVPGQERRDGGDSPDGGEDAPPEGLIQQGAGVRLPGQAGR